MAVLSGVLTALAFPKFNLLFLGWVCLIPLLYLIRDKKPGQSFLLGLIAGTSFYAILIYWIPSVPAHYGNLSFGFSLIIYFLLILYLALYWALFSYFASKIRPIAGKFFFILIPFLWIAFEYLITHLFTGFPWGLIGYSQQKNLFLIQAASLTGVYGVSFILVFLQSLFLQSMTRKKKGPFFIALVVVILIHLGGSLSIPKSGSSEKTIKTAVLQGNISSDIYWNRVSEQFIRNLFFRHIDLTQKAYEKGAQLIVWPEFSVPLCFSCTFPLYQEFKQMLFDYVERTNTTLVIGTNETTVSEEGSQYFNTAMTLKPDLTTSQYYKMHLVPFGEYTPYKNIFSFIQKMTHAIGDISPGKEYHLHDYKGAAFGSPICYEIVFPNLVRKFAKKGAHFLITITNDGWYGNSAAPYQHFSMAVFRAVENRRFLLRAATTGVSGIVDPFGRVIKRSKMETKTFLTADIVPVEKLTLYSRWGDIFPFLCLTLTGLFFILALLKRKQ